MVLPIASLRAHRPMPDHGQSRILTTRPENHVSYIITARYADGRTEKHAAIGALTALIEAAYDRGALGVTAIARRAPL